VYVDVGKYSKAREEFTAIDPLPIADVLDTSTSRRPSRSSQTFKGEKDET